MTLLPRVAALLAAERIPFALIGASALAARGVSRSTHDVDLLTTDRRVLDPTLWSRLAGIESEVRRGDASDPLEGVVRLASSGEADVDLIVGRARWQAAVVDRAEIVRLGEIDLPVARASDLVLLKLFAAGTQDRWDIEQLLATSDRDTIVREVERGLHDLPPASVMLWTTLRGQHPDP